MSGVEPRWWGDQNNTFYEQKNGIFREMSFKSILSKELIREYFGSHTHS